MARGLTQRYVSKFNSQLKKEIKANLNLGILVIKDNMK
jgi:hypothetical protein